MVPERSIEYTLNCLVEEAGARIEANWAPWAWKYWGQSWTGNYLNRILSFKHHFIPFLPTTSHTHPHTHLLAEVYETTGVPRRYFGRTLTKAISPFLSWQPLCPWGRSECSESAQRISACGFADQSARAAPRGWHPVFSPSPLPPGYLLPLRGSGCCLLASSLQWPTHVCPSLWGLLSPEQLRRGPDTHRLLPWCFHSFPFKTYIHPTPRKFLFLLCFYFFPATRHQVKTRLPW